MESIPDSVTHPILGFRKWRIDKRNGLLESAVSDIPWQPGLNHASGCSGSHTSPGPNCHCGFNGWYRMPDNKTSHYKGITGAFAGAGRVQMHKDGFRSSEAQILALLASRQSQADGLAGIADKYGIPVFTDEQEFYDFVTSKALLLDDMEEALSEQNPELTDLFETPKINIGKYSFSLTQGKVANAFAVFLGAAVALLPILACYLLFLSPETDIESPAAAFFVGGLFNSLFFGRNSLFFWFDYFSSRYWLDGACL